MNKVVLYIVLGIVISIIGLILLLPDEEKAENKSDNFLKKVKIELFILLQLLKKDSFLYGLLFSQSMFA